jgi:hypothetical protein
VVRGDTYWRARTAYKLFDCAVGSWDDSSQDGGKTSGANRTGETHDVSDADLLQALDKLPFNRQIALAEEISREDRDVLRVLGNGAKPQDK